MPARKTTAVIGSCRAAAASSESSRTQTKTDAGCGQDEDEPQPPVALGLRRRALHLRAHSTQPSATSTSGLAGRSRPPGRSRSRRSGASKTSRRSSGSSISRACAGRSALTPRFRCTVNAGFGLQVRVPVAPARRAGQVQDSVERPGPDLDPARLAAAGTRGRDVDRAVAPERLDDVSRAHGTQPTRAARSGEQLAVADLVRRPCSPSPTTACRRRRAAAWRA